MPWTLRAALRRAVEVFREEGPRSLWFKMLGETFYRRLILLEASMDDLPEPVAAASSLDFAFLAPTEIGDHSIGELSPQEAAERFRRGDRCFCTRRDGRLVAFRWIALGEAVIDYLGCPLKLAPGVVYIYDAYTAPEARGAGVFATTWFMLAHRLAAEGFHTILGSVLPENRAARRALEKLPYRVAGTLGYIRLGPWKRCFMRARTRAARRG